MKMPNEISDHLLAPCKIACILCHRYCESDESDLRVFTYTTD